MERYADGAKELNDVEVFNNCSYSCYANLADAIQIFAEYEDTGLTPKEITSMIVELSMRYKAYENLTEKNERLQKECVDTYNQMMDTEKDFQRIISESNNEIASLKQSLDELQEKYDALEDGAKNAYGLYKEYQRLEQEGLLVRVDCEGCKHNSLYDIREWEKSKCKVCARHSYTEWEDNFEAEEGSVSE